MQNTDTYSEMAASCARHMARMFGSDECAAKALEQDPTNMVAIAVDAHMETMRKLTVKMHMNQSAFSGQVLSAIK